MLDNRHLWMDTKYTIAGNQVCWEERINNNPASECVYGSWDIFGVKEEDTSTNNISLEARWYDLWIIAGINNEYLLYKLQHQTDEWPRCGRTYTDHTGTQR